MSNILFLDIETTGFSTDWDFILEIAAEIVSDMGHVVGQFHELIRPGKPIPMKIVELTGITNAQVADCRSERDVLRDFGEWVATHPCAKVVGHNCKTFDLRFIRERCAKYGLWWDISDMEIVDTLALARQYKKSGKLNVPNLQQPTIAEYFGIEYEAHTAIEDIHALEKIYKMFVKLGQPVTRESLGF